MSKILHLAEKDSKIFLFTSIQTNSINTLAEHLQTVSQFQNILTQKWSPKVLNMKLNGKCSAGRLRSRCHR
jgi:hypothetical protein